MISYEDRDCERWLQSKGSLKKSDQHYGDWMQAEVDLQTKKTSIIVLGSRPRYPKPTKSQFQTSTKQPDQTATATQPTKTLSGNHQQPPMATLETATHDVIIGTINAHHLEEDCQGN